MPREVRAAFDEDEATQLLRKLADGMEMQAESSRKVAKYITSGDFAGDLAEAFAQALAANEDDDEDEGF